jgi:hypothetical protein
MTLTLADSWEPRGRGRPAIGSRYQATAVKTVTESTNVCVCVCVCVCMCDESVVMSCVLKCPINPITNPDPVCSHLSRERIILIGHVKSLRI